ncbi:phosphotransferase family protein [Egicoccus sp. AB-alg2]|uniref:phosphotransferase family protein n=1 Tax=Egicoccus sp. AB-alg2 TaxID=3242693 RepID=UPI00359D43C9
MKRDRWQTSLRLLARLEGRAFGRRLRPRRAFRIRGATARAEDAGFDGLPALLLDAEDAAPVDAVLHARSAADVVQFGKFDVAAELRLRAFYASADAPATTLRVQRFQGAHMRGVVREARARRVVAQHAPEVAPRLFEVGVDKRAKMGFLSEECLDGRHPADRGEVQQAGAHVAAALDHLHRSAGLARKRLSEVTSDRLPERWAAAVGHLPVSATVRQRVQTLFDRDAHLEVGLGHGDIVGSNIVLVGDMERVVLIDWEHAGELPVAFDLAKLHLQARHPEQMLAVFRDTFGDRVGRGSDGYALEEQFALAHVQMLAWHEHRVARAQDAGRLAAYERDTARRMELVESLLG